MKFLFENWRKHLDEQDNVNIQSAVLNEISQNDYEMIKRWMTDAPDSAYSFDNLFTIIHPFFNQSPLVSLR